MSVVFPALTSTLSYIIANALCRVTHWFRPKPPLKPDYRDVYTSPKITVDQHGECGKGTYIRVYKPSTPYLGDNNRPKVIVYLHGFALGAYEIYEAHLQHLAHQGYYVFFPNYQTGFCSFPPNLLLTFAELAEAVIGDGSHSQEKWMKGALKSVASAFETVGFTPDTELDTYLFGHSLGGLFALSWPYYVQQENYPTNMLPQQVVVADPIPNTAIANVPGELGQLLKKITDDVDIKRTRRS